MKGGQEVQFHRPGSTGVSGGKMLKITAFNGSARKDGNTAILLNAALAELRARGFETELVQLAGRPLRGCRACGGCFKNKE